MQVEALIDWKSVPVVGEQPGACIPGAHHHLCVFLISTCHGAKELQMVDDLTKVLATSFHNGFDSCDLNLPTLGLHDALDPLCNRGIVRPLESQVQTVVGKFPDLLVWSVVANTNHRVLCDLYQVDESFHSAFVTTCHSITLIHDNHAFAQTAWATKAQGLVAGQRVCHAIDDGLVASIRSVEFHDIPFWSLGYQCASCRLADSRRTTHQNCPSIQVLWWRLELFHRIRGWGWQLFLLSFENHIIPIPEPFGQFANLLCVTDHFAQVSGPVPVRPRYLMLRLRLQRRHGAGLGVLDTAPSVCEERLTRLYLVIFAYAPVNYLSLLAFGKLQAIKYLLLPTT